MGGTYKATGINLKSIPLGESDRLLTILTPEFGIIRAIAPGARKYKSSLRGRSNLFILNDLLLVRGKSLDRMIQAECLASFSSIGSDLGKLTVGQYLAELVLCQALAGHPQPDLFALLQEYLTRLDQRSPQMALANLVQATYHLLAYGGVTPQVFHCCLTQQPILPDLSNPNWSVHFDVVSGGIVVMPQCTESKMAARQVSLQLQETPPPSTGPKIAASEVSARYRINTEAGKETTVELNTVKNNIAHSDAPWDGSVRVPEGSQHPQQKRSNLYIQLNAEEVMALQKLAQPDILDSGVTVQTWLSIERVLRHYAQYHFEKPIRSASLIETCFVLTD